MPAKCYLNTLGGKPFVSESTIIVLVLICSRLIVGSWIFFHNIKPNINMLGSLGFLIIVIIKYCWIIVAV
jgi:hypothetical protein